MTVAAICRLPFANWQMKLMQLDLFTDENQPLSFGKTCPESFQPQTMLLGASLQNWLAQTFRLEPQQDDSQVQVWLADESALSAGESSMPNTSERPKCGGVSFSLRETLAKGGGANPAKILFEYSGSDGDSAPLTGAADTKRIRRRAEETNSKPVIVYDARHREGAREYRNIVPTLIAAMGTGGNNVPVLVDENGEIRKLTPTECERLQGFPDDYTKIPYNGKEPDKCPDMYRYRAIGNSWAVPVVRWLGKRIDDEMKGEDQ